MAELNFNFDLRDQHVGVNCFALYVIVAKFDANVHVHFMS